MNYFNYFTEIEDAFVRRRGKHLFLSPMDWALMESWKQEGIPLHIVLRAVERAFDSFESRPRKRSVKSLLYCQEEVEAQFAEWLESRVGEYGSVSAEEANADSKTTFSTGAVKHHLEEKRELLITLAEARRGHADDDLVEALTRAATRLTELLEDFNVAGKFDTRRLEDALTAVERMLNDAIRSATSLPDLKMVTTELKQQLKPYRSQMERPVYEQTLNNLLLKRLREHFGIPRLSLFYL